MRRPERPSFIAMSALTWLFLAAIIDPLFSNPPPPPPSNPPTNLTATTISSTQINLAWTDNSANEDGFKIERKTGSGGTWGQIAMVGANVTTYPNINLSHGTLYYYRVRAYNAGGNSAYSNQANATTVLPPPNTLSANAVAYTQINLAWTDASTGESGFRIERKTGSGGAWGEITTVSANVTSYPNSGLSQGTTYYYKVRAYKTTADGTVYSTYSNEPNATTPLPEPSAFSVSTASSTQINLSWTDNSTGETGFKIERQGGCPYGSWSQIDTVGANITSYQNTSLSQGITYNYRVRAYTTYTNSTYSGEDSDVATLPAPTGLAAYVTASRQINLSWTDNSTGESGFKIERKIGSGGSWGQIDTVGANATSYQNTNLDHGTSYWYRVRAYTTCADSAYTNVEDDTTILPVPSGLGATTFSSTEIDLSWTDNSIGEAGFKIERKIGSGGDWEQIDTVGANVTTYPNTGLDHGTTYYYRARAYTAYMDSSYSGEDSDTTTIPAPTNLDAGTTSSTQMELDWTDNSTGETGFRIERKTGAGGSWSEIDTVDENETSYLDTDLNHGTTYYYQIRGYTPYTTSPYAADDHDTTILPAPTALDAHTTYSTLVEMAWTDNATSETGFKIERKLASGGNWSEIDTVEEDETSYQDINLDEGTAYYYRVRTYSTYAISTYTSDSLSTTTLPGPDDLVTTASSSSHIVLAWEPNSEDQTGFAIERMIGVAGEWEEIDTVGAGVLQYQDTNLTTGTTYCYQVRAYTPDAYSSYSDYDLSVTKLSAPSDLTVTTMSDSRIDLDWTYKSSDTKEFIVERSRDGTGLWVEATRIDEDDYLTTHTYSDTTADASTTYHYRVCAYKSGQYNYDVNKFSGYVRSNYTNNANTTTDANPEPLFFLTNDQGDIVALVDTEGNLLLKGLFTIDGTGRDPNKGEVALADPIWSIRNSSSAVIAAIDTEGNMEVKVGLEEVESPAEPSGTLLVLHNGANMVFTVDDDPNGRIRLKGRLFQRLGDTVRLEDFNAPDRDALPETSHRITTLKVGTSPDERWEFVDAVTGDVLNDPSQGRPRPRGFNYWVTLPEGKPTSDAPYDTSFWPEPQDLKVIANPETGELKNWSFYDQITLAPDIESDDPRIPAGYNSLFDAIIPFSAQKAEESLIDMETYGYNLVRLLAGDRLYTLDGQDGNALADYTPPGDYKPRLNQAHLENLMRYLDLARQHKIHVILVFGFLPQTYNDIVDGTSILADEDNDDYPKFKNRSTSTELDHYYDIVGESHPLRDKPRDILGFNAYFMHKGAMMAQKKYIDDTLTAIETMPTPLLARQNLKEVLLGVELINEPRFEAVNFIRGGDSFTIDSSIKLHSAPWYMQTNCPKFREADDQYVSIPSEDDLPVKEYCSSHGGYTYDDVSYQGYDVLPFEDPLGTDWYALNNASQRLQLAQKCASVFIDQMLNNKLGIDLRENHPGTMFSISLSTQYFRAGLAGGYSGVWGMAGENESFHIYSVVKDSGDNLVDYLSVFAYPTEYSQNFARYDLYADLASIEILPHDDTSQMARIEVGGTSYPIRMPVVISETAAIHIEQSDLIGYRTLDEATCEVKCSIDKTEEKYGFSGWAYFGWTTKHGPTATRLLGSGEIADGEMPAIGTGPMRRYVYGASELDDDCRKLLVHLTPNDDLIDCALGLCDYDPGGMEHNLECPCHEPDDPEFCPTGEEYLGIIGLEP